MPPKRGVPLKVKAKAATGLPRGRPKKGVGASATSKANKFTKYLSARLKMGLPDSDKAIIRTSYKTFTKGTEYDKLKALSFFSAIKNPEYALPMPNSLGVFTTANFSKRAGLTTSTTSNNITYMILQFTPTQVHGMTYVQVGATATAVAAVSILNFADLDASAPAHVRQSRMTLSLINTTASTNVAGSVTSLYVNNGLEWEFSPSALSLELTANFQNEISTMVDSNSRSKLHSASKFIGDADSSKFHLIPSSMSNLEEWKVYTTGFPDITSAKLAFVNGSTNFTHSTLILRFDNTSTANTYLGVINAQYALRYPANSILSSIVHTQPPADKNAIENHANVLDGEGNLPSTMAWQIERPVTTIEQGFNKAYGNHNNQYYYDSSNGSLFIAGTDPFDVRDLVTDVKIPLGLLHTTDRYKKAEQLLKLYKPAKLYGHSLGGAIVGVLGNKYKIPYETYGSPDISLPWQKVTNRHRHPGDPISILDMGATSERYSLNPHSYTGFDKN